MSARKAKVGSVVYGLGTQREPISQGRSPNMHPSRNHIAPSPKPQAPSPRGKVRVSHKVRFFILVTTTRVLGVEFRA